MTVTFIIIAALLWGASLVALFGRQLLAPAFSYLALLALSFARTPEGYRMLPLNGTILTVWLAMTLVVMVAVTLQRPEMRAQTRGEGFLLGGGLTGLALGLLGTSATATPAGLYAWMILGTAAGIVGGFLLYTSTRDGRGVAPRSGRFFTYLLAKGFPTAITLMQLGVALVLWMAMSNVNAL